MGGLKVIIMQVSVQIGLNWNHQLELSLPKYKARTEKYIYKTKTKGIQESIILTETRI